MTEAKTTAAVEEVLSISRLVAAEETCVVSHPDAGGACERVAAMTVYGLPFCERHGTECEAEARSVVWDDA